jgi:hypothetical protein
MIFHQQFYLRFSFLICLTLRQFACLFDYLNVCFSIWMSVCLF